MKATHDQLVARLERIQHHHSNLPRHAHALAGHPLPATMPTTPPAAPAPQRKGL